MHSRGTARALLKGKAAEEATVRAARDARTSLLFVSSRGMRCRQGFAPGVVTPRLARQPRSRPPRAHPCAFASPC